MNKKIKVDQVRRAVKSTVEAGIGAGAFFIMGYPGETDTTMLDTIKLASSLPFDYVSLTLPYPIPGTRLYDRVKGRMIMDDLKKETHGLVKHELIYGSDFSANKLKFGILKAMTQHKLRKMLGKNYRLIEPLERVTDKIFSAMG